MPNLKLFWCLGLLPASSLFGQAATRAQAQLGAQGARQQQLDSLSNPPAKESANTPWRSLSREEADDPTLQSTAAPHEAPREARKAAQKAEHLSAKGNHQEAIELLRHALAIDPEYYEAGNNLALELEAAGKKDEAELEFRRLIETAPQHVLAFTNLANLLAAQGRYAGVEKVARQSMTTHRFSFRTNYMLGMSLVKQSKWTAEAKESLQYAQVKCVEAKPLLDQWPQHSPVSN